jgi:hypothetical protein
MPERRRLGVRTCSDPVLTHVPTPGSCEAWNVRVVDGRCEVDRIAGASMAMGGKYDVTKWSGSVRARDLQARPLYARLWRPQSDSKRKEYIL